MKTTIFRLHIKIPFVLHTEGNVLLLGKPIAGCCIRKSQGTYSYKVLDICRVWCKPSGTYAIASRKDSKGYCFEGR